MRSRFTRRKSAQPGMPRSRENAYQVREALVRPAATQKSWPTVAIRRTIFAAHGSSALVKIVPTNPSPSLTACDVGGGEQEARAARASR